MADKLKLMAVLAHPDDESLGVGGTLAKYASEGVETYLVTATRGERGRFGNAEERPPLKIVGETREAELLAAAKVLGIKEVNFLDYIDSDLDKADPKEVISKIVLHLRQVKPQVVVTFGPEGAYGHTDHIAICQFTTAAVICAADSNYMDSQNQESTHRVSKLYYIEWSKDKFEAYQNAFRNITTTIDGVERKSSPWPDWVITTVIDTEAHWQTVWKAVNCHQTQMAIYGRLKDLPAIQHKVIWGTQEFYRAFSTVNGGRKRETDLFEGLRDI